MQLPETVALRKQEFNKKAHGSPSRTTYDIIVDGEWAGTLSIDNPHVVKLVTWAFNLYNTAKKMPPGARRR